MPAISVIIPVYNCETFIGDAISSVQAQTMQDFEIVVVNDGSTDRTLAVVESMARQDERIKVVSQENSGKPSIARNVGIRHSSGEYLCFLDGDDFYLPTKLEKELEVLRKYPTVDLVFHDVLEQTDRHVPMEGSYLGRADFPASAAGYLSMMEDRIYLCRKNFYNFMSAYCATILMSAPMLKRACLDSQLVWFPEFMIIGEDIDLWFRLAMIYGFAYLDESLSCYRRHDKSITKNLEGFLKGSIEVHKRNYQRGCSLLTKAERIRYKSRIGALHWHLAYFFYSKYEMAAARKEIINSLRLNVTLKAVVTFFKSLLPTNIIRLCKAYSKRQIA
ncbi:glycosyltransferase family 2 protein [Geotalea sp. SG265]|uniref:glycosyltransferase family 2 protein n=1 Tax=Geotalea sp. SG265 TaxID=2922867 RepID=UPI001FAE95BC|nr:glycosyltransferase family 2 protein [Geotalea sp. SG265]